MGLATTHPPQRGPIERNETMTTFYVIRRGWNAANQSSVGRARNPKSTFESGLDKLVAIVETETEQDAIEKAAESCSVYNGQFLRAVSNPRAINGLTAELLRKGLIPA
jgi:hypothetical protein